MFKLLAWGLLSSVAAKSSGQVLKRPIPDKLVVLTFDDAIKSHFTNVAPLLKQYHFNATFFVCEFPPDFADTAKYMTWQQVKQLNDMGFEIGNHTKNHVDVDKISNTEFINELKYIEDKCVSMQIPRPVSFAYPGNNIHPRAIDILEERGYLFAREGTDRAYDPQSKHPFLVPAFTVLATNKKQVIDAFAQAKNGKIVVLTIHGVPDNAHPWVTLPVDIFKEYLQYLHDNNFTVISIKEMAEYVNIEKALTEIRPVFIKAVGKRMVVFLLAAIVFIDVVASALSKFLRRS